MVPCQTNARSGLKHTNCGSEIIVAPSDQFLIWFTGLLVLIGGLQAWILRATLTVSRASVRAYVLVRCENVLGMTLGDRPRLVVVFKNFGSTPAYRLRHHSQISFAEYPMSDDYKLPKIVIRPSREMTITPQVEYGNPVVGSRPFTQEHLDEIEAHHARMLIYGRVRYRTLGRWHHTSFAFFYLGNQTFIMAPDGNDAD